PPNLATGYHRLFARPAFEHDFMYRSSAALLAVLTLVPIAAAQEKTPVRLFAEAEDFAVKSPGWKVVPFRENYYACTFAVTFLSRMACLGAPEQLEVGKPAVAEQVVQIP